MPLRKGIFASSRIDFASEQLTATFNGLTGLTSAPASSSHTFDITESNVVVGITTRGTQTLNSVTVGGTVLTKDIEQAKIGASDVRVALFHGAVTPGVGVPVVVTYAGIVNNMAVAVWSLNAPITYHSYTKAHLTTDIQTPAATPNSVLIGVAQSQIGTATGEWTGLVRDSVATYSFWTSVAHLENPAADTVSITTTLNNFATSLVGVYDLSSSPVFDSFNRADSTTGLGTADTGQEWSQVDTGTIGIIDNAAYRVSGYPTLGFINFGHVPMYVSAIYTQDTAWWPVIIACAAPDGSGGFTGGFSIQKDNGLSVKLSGYGSAYSFALGDKIGLKVSSASPSTVNVSLLINDIIKITWTGQPKPVGTWGGIDLGNVSSIRLDNFRIEAP